MLNFILCFIRFTDFFFGRRAYSHRLFSSLIFYHYLLLLLFLIILYWPLLFFLLDWLCRFLWWRVYNLHRLLLSLFLLLFLIFFLLFLLFILVFLFDNFFSKSFLGFGLILTKFSGKDILEVARYAIVRQFDFPLIIDSNSFWFSSLLLLFLRSQLLLFLLINSISLLFPFCFSFLFLNNHWLFLGATSSISDSISIIKFRFFNNHRLFLIFCNKLVLFLLYFQLRLLYNHRLFFLAFPFIILYLAFIFQLLLLYFFIFEQIKQKSLRCPSCIDTLPFLDLWNVVHNKGVGIMLHLAFHVRYTEVYVNKIFAFITFLIYWLRLNLLSLLLFFFLLRFLFLRLSSFADSINFGGNFGFRFVSFDLYWSWYWLCDNIIWVWLSRNIHCSLILFSYGDHLITIIMDVVGPSRKSIFHCIGISTAKVKSSTPKWNQRYLPYMCSDLSVNWKWDASEAFWSCYFGFMIQFKYSKLDVAIGQINKREILKKSKKLM